MSGVQSPPLVVEPLGAGSYRVTCGGSCGGSGWHLVTIGADVASCDCPARVACRHLKVVLDHLLLAPLEHATAAGPGLERDVPLPEGPA